MRGRACDCEWLDRVDLEGPFVFLSSQTAPGRFCSLHITVTKVLHPKSRNPTDHRSPSPVSPDWRGWHPWVRCPVAQASASNCTWSQYHQTPQATTSSTSVH